jgi:hypothetical protein
MLPPRLATLCSIAVCSAALAASAAPAQHACQKFGRKTQVSCRHADANNPDKLHYNVDKCGTELWGESVRVDANGNKKGQEGWPLKQVRGRPGEEVFQTPDKGPTHLFELIVTRQPLEGGVRGVMVSGKNRHAMVCALGGKSPAAAKKHACQEHGRKTQWSCKRVDPNDPDKLSYDVDKCGPELWGQSVLIDENGAKKGQEGWPVRQVRGKPGEHTYQTPDKGPNHLFELVVTKTPAGPGGFKATMSSGGKASEMICTPGQN